MQGTNHTPHGWRNKEDDYIRHGTPHTPHGWENREDDFGHY